MIRVRSGASIQEEKVGLRLDPYPHFEEVLGTSNVLQKERYILFVYRRDNAEELTRESGKNDLGDESSPFVL